MLNLRSICIFKVSRIFNYIINLFINTNINEFFLRVFKGAKKMIRYIYQYNTKIDWLVNFGQSPVQGAARSYSTQLLNNSLTTIQSVR